MIGTVSENSFDKMTPGFETQAQALLRFKNGKTASFQALLATHAVSNAPCFQVYGTKVGINR